MDKNENFSRNIAGFFCRLTRGKTAPVNFPLLGDHRISKNDFLYRRHHIDWEG